MFIIDELEVILTYPYPLYKTNEEDFVYYTDGGIVNIEDFLCIDAGLIDEVLYDSTLDLDDVLDYKNLDKDSKELKITHE